MTQTLAGDWALADDTGQYACRFALPGDGITALYDAGLIADPYWGKNEDDLRWISLRDWTATRSFDLDTCDVDLVLGQVDTVVTVRVNGVVVLTASNAFRTYRVPLRDVARLGDNTISITFHSPVVAGKALSDAHDFPLPWSHNCPIPYGNFLRKPACDFGWDWNIALAPFGVYGALDIVPASAARIDHLSVSQTHAPGQATLHVSAHVSHYDGPVQVSFAGQVVTASPGETVAITVDKPQLWWPTGHGDQSMYDLVVTAGDAQETRRIGLRDLALVTEPDSAGLGFKFRINGRDIFCKGANWIPADALPGRITAAKTRDLLQSAVQANMNMIRVWGGGRYEPDSFYAACDELGLLVWQDFMFACNLYPSDPAFLAEVAAEVRENTARLHHHACIAVWCGDNELIGALGWYDVSRKDRDRYLVNYDRLNRAIEAALRDTVPTAIWWPSSPSPGPLSFGDAWHNDGAGDMHFWSVWHEGRDFDHYRDVSPRFCSEFGFQSYPSMATIRKFADPADFNIAAPVLESHQKNAGGNARIAETMFRYFRWPARFEDFVYLSQIQQGEAIKTAVTHWRTLAPHCMGTLIWQLNDTWPVCSWSSLDYGGGWKLMHYMARRFYAPTLVTAKPTKDGGIAICGHCDGPVSAQITLRIHAVTMDGAMRPLDMHMAQLTDHAAQIAQVPHGALGQQEMLFFDWSTDTGETGQDTYAPKPFKSYDLRPPVLVVDKAYKNGVWHLHISAQKPAFFVAVEADQPGRFSDNGFTILPGTPVTVQFTPDHPAQPPHFTMRDLHTATFTERICQ